MGVLLSMESLLEKQSHLPPQFSKLLIQFKEVFEEPTKLPPARVFDHSIPLLPGSVPINLRPYRYSPAQKLEIEKQVQGLLHSQVIRRSHSHFASQPYLLKRKMVLRGCVWIIEG